jgi:hypothetical protein
MKISYHLWYENLGEKKLWWNMLKFLLSKWLPVSFPSNAIGLTPLAYSTNTFFYSVLIKRHGFIYKSLNNHAIEG